MRGRPHGLPRDQPSVQVELEGTAREVARKPLPPEANADGLGLSPQVEGEDGVVYPVERPLWPPRLVRSALPVAPPVLPRLLASLHHLQVGLHRLSAEAFARDEGDVRGSLVEPLVLPGSPEART